MSSERDTSLGRGVSFAPDDYIRGRWRVFIVVIDLLAIIATWMLSSVVLFVIRSGHIDELDLTLLGLFLAWIYLTVVKTSRIGTVGYWLTGSKIVDLRGGKPSILCMTYRLLIGLFGPFRLLIDYVWSGVDDDKQTLHDRFAGTCVVRRKAVQSGTGEIHLTCYTGMGLVLMYPRVTRVDAT
ncbi:MAG: RDD family protein [Planctomycetaceae bacterium]|nr:RDD family protein [Planctomycetaceae bacterium]MCB9953274.1 RDD family protein [Planctomycetaceae bacterium]